MNDNMIYLIFTETSSILFLKSSQLVVCSMSPADHRGRAVNKIFMLIMILGTLFAFFTSVGIDYIHIHSTVAAQTCARGNVPPATVSTIFIGLDTKITIHHELMFANNLEIRIQCSSLSSQS